MSPWLGLAAQTSSAHAAPTIDEPLILPDVDLIWPRTQRVAAAAWRNQVTVVCLWGIFCPVCKQWLPELDAMLKGYRAKGLHVLTISIDRQPDGCIDYLRREKMELPLAMANDDLFAVVGKTHITPKTWVVDRQGDVRHVWYGHPPAPDQHKMLKLL